MNTSIYLFIYLFFFFAALKFIKLRVENIGSESITILIKVVDKISKLAIRLILWYKT